MPTSAGSEGQAEEAGQGDPQSPSRRETVRATSTLQFRRRQDSWLL